MLSLLLSRFMGLGALVPSSGNGIDLAHNGPSFTLPPVDASLAEFLSVPLTVNGKTINPSEMKRFLIYGPARIVLEKRKLEYLVGILPTLSNRNEGPPDQEQIAANDIERYAAAYEAEVGSNWPATSLLGRHRTVAVLRRQPGYVKARFDLEKYYLHGDPAKWPIATRWALKVKETKPGRLTPEAIVESALRARRESGAASLDELDWKESEQTVQFLLGLVIDEVLSEVSVLTAAHGSPPGIAMILDAQGIAPDVYQTSAAFEEALPILGIQDGILGRRWCAIVECTRQRLLEDNRVTSLARSRIAVGIRDDAPIGCSPDLSSVSPEMYTFPSPECYYEYYTLFDAFVSRLPSYVEGRSDSDTEQVMPGFTVYRAEWDSLPAGVEAEMIEILPTDCQDEIVFNGRLEIADKVASDAAEALRRTPDMSMADLYTECRNRLEELLPGKQMEDDGSNARAESRVVCRFDGRRLYWRSQLFERLGDNAFSRLTTGASIADRVCMQDSETTCGPYRGAYGYYYVRVCAKRVPQQSRSVSAGEASRKVFDGYLRAQFLAYARKAFADSNIVGLR